MLQHSKRRNATIARRLWRWHRWASFEVQRDCNCNVRNCILPPSQSCGFNWASPRCASSARSRKSMMVSTCRSGGLRGGAAARGAGLMILMNFWLGWQKISWRWYWSMLALEKHRRGSTGSRGPSWVARRLSRRSRRRASRRSPRRVRWGPHEANEVVIENKK